MTKSSPIVTDSRPIEDVIKAPSERELAYAEFAKRREVNKDVQEARRQQMGKNYR